MSKSRCSDDEESLIDKGSRSKIFREISLDVMINYISSLFERPTLPWLHSDGLCQPTPKHRFLVLLLEETCSVFHIFDFIGRISKLNNSYRLETDDLLMLEQSTLRKFLKANHQLFSQILIHHWEQLLQPYHGCKCFHEQKLSGKNSKKCTKLTIHT